MPFSPPALETLEPEQSFTPPPLDSLEEDRKASPPTELANADAQRAIEQSQPTARQQFEFDRIWNAATNSPIPATNYPNDTYGGVALNKLTGLVKGVTSPAMLATGSLGAVPGVGKAVTAAFLADTGLHLKDLAAGIRESNKTPPLSPQRVGSAADVLTTAAIGKLLTSHLLKGAPAPDLTTTNKGGEITDASTSSSNSEIQPQDGGTIEGAQLPSESSAPGSPQEGGPGVRGGPGDNLGQGEVRGQESGSGQEATPPADRQGGTDSPLAEPAQPGPTSGSVPSGIAEISAADVPPVAPTTLKNLADLPAIDETPVEPARSIRFGVADGGFAEQPLIQFIQGEAGGIMSKSTAREKWGAAKYKENQSLWNDAPDLPDPRHNKIYNRGSGLTPDKVATMAAERGLLPDGADATTLFQAVKQIADSAHNTAKLERAANAQQVIGERQARAFTAAVAKPGKGERAINASELQTGDTVKVGTETLKVNGIDPDTFDVELEDGSKFGVQHVADGQVFYGEHTPVPRRTLTEDPFAEPAKIEPPPIPPETPRTTGIAQRIYEEQAKQGAIGEITPGEGISWQDSVARGRDLLNQGADPGAVANRVTGNGRINADDIAVLRAERERLNVESNRLADAVAARPSTELKAQLKQARETETDFIRNAVKPAQTEWHKIGMAQQGEAPIDTSTFAGLRRAVLDARGRDVKPSEAPRLRAAAENVGRATDMATRALQRAAETVEKRVRPRNSKPRSIEELRDHFSERIKQLTPCST